ncbi:MAG: TonB-dependent receptor [Acidobacteria bacterium]|nr:TonB-dependent receptor [Acidobacteriota bacterium]
MFRSKNNMVRYPKNRPALAAAFLMAASLRAQVTTATFYGIVTDPTGAVVAGAAATLTNEGTQAVLRQTSDAAGEFAFNFVPPGSYTLRVQATGFKVSLNKGIPLSAAESLRRTFALEVGAVSESVEVTSQAALVNTVSAEQRESIGTTQVQELPLSRRNVAGLVTLSTGVTRSGGDVYLNGAGRGGTSVAVDGTDATGNPERPSLAMFGGFNYINGISIEAVGEVQIIKGVIPAEYTRSMGGNLNIISRSGSNQFHGSLFENFRAENLNARLQFLSTKPGVTFNQFGGSLAGPILKDRLFGLFVYEGYRERAFAAVSGNVPTERLRNDMLRAVPAYKTFLDTLPLPNQPHNTAGTTGQFIGAGSRKNTDNHMVIKPDWRISDSMSASVTFTRFRPTAEQPRVQPINSRQFTGVTDRVSAIFTYFKSRWTSESRYGYNKNVVDRLDAIFNVKDPNRAENKAGGRRLPCINALGFGGCGEILTLGAPNHSFDQKVAFITGRHSLKFGGVFFRRSIGRANIENPDIRFQNEADLLANIPNLVQMTFGTDLYTARSKEWGMFLQDDFRVNKKLVVNFGIRNDYFGNYVASAKDGGPPHAYNRGFVDFATFRHTPIRPIDNPFDSDGINIAPRVGFSYNPDGNSRNVIRGGFSTMFTNMAGETVTQTVQNSLVDPFRSAFSRAEALQFGLKYPQYNEDVIKLVAGGASGGSPRVINPQIVSPYAFNLYFGIQRQLSAAMALETAYAGNRGVKWHTSRQANEVNPLTGIRPNPAFARMDYWDNADSTWYNSWQTSLRYRMSNRLTANIHHTWSKATAYGAGDVGWTSTNTPNFYDLRSNHALADGSVLHVFNVDAVYELPRLGSSTAAVRHALGGWQVSTIFNAQTGAGINLSHPTGISGTRPDYLGGQPILDNYRGTLVYLNRAAFAAVPENNLGNAIRLGNLGRNALRGPGRWAADVSFGKNFSIGERYRLQIRTDLFNAFNHTNYGNPDTNIESANFGRITSTAGAREIQLNARFVF